MVDGEWRPWRELRARSEIEFDAVDLPEGMRALWVRDRATGARAILVNKRLSPEERLFALTHELVHDERGGSGDHPDLPGSLAPMVAREENRTDELAARRILSIAEVALWVALQVELGHQVTAQAAADEFGVALEVAERALLRLKGAA